MSTVRHDRTELTRTPPREDPFRVPRPVPGEPGRFLVDATWGTIGAMEAAPGVRTIGELELVAHIEAGLPVIDTRSTAYFAAGTIPTARSVPHADLEDHLDEIDPGALTALFCNGPACAATPQSIRKLLAAGREPSQILYYRGGLHDWLTLGLPVEVPEAASG